MKKLIYRNVHMNKPSDETWKALDKVLTEIIKRNNIKYNENPK